MKKYESLKAIYPEHISLDQFRCICHIAKRSALYLIQQEIIPAINTGKQTWRYKIALDDVITYLRRREQWGSMIPPGAVSSRSAHVKKQSASFAQIIKPENEDALRQYFSFRLADYPDVLKVQDIAGITGLNSKTVLLLLKKDVIQHIARQGGYLVPKAYLLEYVGSKDYINRKSNSDAFKNVLDDFLLWQERKNSRSSSRRK